MNILNYSPGQKATIFLEVANGNHVRMDPLTLPVVSKIMLPDFTNDGYDGYQLPMTKLDTGLYVFQFILPTGAASVGSYFIEVSYTNPFDAGLSVVGYQLAVSAPYGIYSASVTTTI